MSQRGIFASLDPELQDRLAWAWDGFAAEGGTIRLTSGYRSITKQRALYQAFLEGRTRYPVAPPGRSKHNYRLAVDLVTNDLERFVDWARAAGIRWAGRRDPVHFDI